MYKKILSMALIFIMFMILVELKVNYVNAKENDNNESRYELRLMKYVAYGPYWYIADTENEICLNASGSVEANRLIDYYMCVVEKKSDGSARVVEENLDLNNLKIESSDERYLKTEIRDGRVLVKGVAEGKSKADVTITYTYNGVTCTNTSTWTVRPVPTPYFVVGYNTAVLLDDSIVELNKNQTKDVSVYFSTLQTMRPVYPDGYTEDSYFKCQWSVLDESVVKIKGVKNNKKVTLEAVGNGETKVKCVVSTPFDKRKVIRIINVVVDEDYRLQPSIYQMGGIPKNYIEMGSEDKDPSDFVTFVHNGKSLEINKSNIKVKSSKTTVIDIKEQDNGISKFEIVGEGLADIDYTYVYEGNEYKLTVPFCVFNDNEKFKNGEQTLISSNYVVLPMGDSKTSKTIQTVVTNLGSLKRSEDKYNFEWSVKDEDVISIKEEDSKDGKSSVATIASVPAQKNKSPETELYCKISTLDGSESFTKTIKVKLLITMTGDDSNSDNETFEKILNTQIINTETEENQFEMVPTSEHTNTSGMIKVGGKIVPSLGLKESLTNQVTKIDKSKLSIQVSNQKLVSINNNTIEAKAEGKVEVIYKYSSNGEEYSYGEVLYIYNEGFSNGDYPVITNSIINLDLNGKSDNINVYMINSTMPGIESENYTYEWKIDGDPIVKIEDNNDNSNSMEYPKSKTGIKITSLKAGTTKVICVIKSKISDETITKVATVTVGNGIQSGDGQDGNVTSNLEDEKDEKDNKDDKNNKDEKGEDNSTADSILPQTGGKISIAIVLTILAILTFIIVKRKKDTNY